MADLPGVDVLERTLTCPQCGAVFNTTHPRAICCSRDCTVKRNRAIQNAKRYAGHPEVDCLRCGTTFKRPRSDSRFCSTKCLRAWTWAENVPQEHTLTCGFCGQSFQWRTRRPNYCSRACQRRATYDRNAEARRVYSREWNATHGKDPKWRPMNTAKYQRRRAAKVGQGGPGITASEWRRVLRRAQGCFYCGAREPLTMDHVVPLSRGGLHSLGNVVAACGRCNSSKGGKLVIEWRMRLARGQVAC